MLSNLYWGQTGCRRRRCLTVGLWCVPVVSPCDDTAAAVMLEGRVIAGICPRVNCVTGMLMDTGETARLML